MANTYSDWLDLWLKEKQKKMKIRLSTYTSYQSLIENHIKPSLGSMPVEKIGEDEIFYSISKFESIGLAEKTIKDIVFIIKSTIKAYCKQNKIFIPSLDGVFIAKRKPHRVEIFSDSEQHEIMRAVFRNLDNKTIGIALSLLAGLRIGEVCGLQWKDIDFVSRQMNIEKTVQRVRVLSEDSPSKTTILIGSPKTQSSYRSIPIPSTLYNILDALRTDNPNSFITSNSEKKPLEPRIMRAFFNRFLKQNNIYAKSDLETG